MTCFVHDSLSSRRGCVVPGCPDLDATGGCLCPTHQTLEDNLAADYAANNPHPEVDGGCRTINCMGVRRLGAYTCTKCAPNEVQFLAMYGELGRPALEAALLKERGTRCPNSSFCGCKGPRRPGFHTCRECSVYEDGYAAAYNARVAARNVVSTPANLVPPMPLLTAEKTMPPENPLLKSLEVDATEAAWRLAGSQFVKLAKEPIVALLQRHLGPGDESMRARIAAFLDTELGTALLSGVLSAGLSAMPLPANNVSQQLAKELRVRSMASTGDVIADVLMGPLRQVAVMYLQGQPAAPSDPAGLPAGGFHGFPAPVEAAAREQG